MYQGWSAVGYRPSSQEEFAGFNSFAISGFSQNTNIYRVYLKLVLNSTYGTSGPLHFNIKYTGSTTPPSVQSIITPPFHLENQLFPYIIEGSTEYYLLPPVLYPYIIQASTDNLPFVLGYSRYNQDTSVRFFYDWIGDPTLDATLLVFVDPCSQSECLSLPKRLTSNFLTDSLMEINVQEKERVEIEIFDISGRLILKPVDRIFEPGIYKIKINNYGLKKGIYFLILKRKEKETKKLIILK